MEHLQEQIEALNKQLAIQLPPEVIAAFNEAIAGLKSRNITQNALKTGASFPDGALLDHKGETVWLSGMQQRKKLVIAFFRGSWCPYCNLELKALQDAYPLILEKEAELIAVSPQMPVYNTALLEEHPFGFKIFTDKDNDLAKQSGIAFTLPDFVIPYYESLGIKLQDFNNTAAAVLPIPAIFVINEDNSIAYRFIDADYRNRIVISELIAAL